MSKFSSSFPSVECVFKDMYKLELASKIEVQPIFHASLINPLKEGTLWLDCKQVIWLPPKLIDDYLEYEVEGILKSGNFKKNKKEYLIKWRGYYMIGVCREHGEWKVNNKKL
jgi:hypothetical protein